MISSSTGSSPRMSGVPSWGIGPGWLRRAIYVLSCGFVEAMPSSRAEGGFRSTSTPIAGGWGKQALRRSVRTPKGVAGAATFLVVTVLIRLITRFGHEGDWRTGA